MNNYNHPDLSKSFLSKEEISKSFSRALTIENLITDEDTAVIFYDLAHLNERVINLKSLFPKTTVHAIAVKANPLIKILRHLRQFGVALEVASLPELFLAEKAGYSPEKIVFDSPSKTINELEYALKKGVYINADSFSELDRIGAILQKIKSKSIIGVRINPQIGHGSIKSTSVADIISKFGIPILNHKNKLIEYFLKYDWLQGVHVHIGSQGCGVQLIIDGIKRVYDFTREANNALMKNAHNHKITIFNIGGGLAVSYEKDKLPVSMYEYHKLLNESIPELFSNEFKLITEFGRYIHANTAWAASKVEYVKRENDYTIIMTHVGADFLLRKSYNPEDWHHEITLVDKNGNLKSGKDINKYIIAGPLCFAGDIIAKDIELPYVEEGDYIIIHDIGAYTLSMWSRYNSRQIPKVIGYEGFSGQYKIFKERESNQDILNFWS
jgi:diaminopimelate decarboxylase